MNRIAIYLNQHIDGVVYSAPNVLEHYSTDRSLLKFHPRIVAIPANTNDIRRLVKFSNQLAAKKISLPITVRGAGYSKTGSSIGNGLIISTEKLNHIQEIDVRQRLIRVQAGVTLGELKKALGVHGLDLPVSGDPHETIGGLIAKNASASVNTEPKTIIDFVEEAEIILSDGSLIETDNYSPRTLKKKLNQKNLEGEIYRQVKEILDKQSENVMKIALNTQNRSGYSGIKSVQEKRNFNLLPLFCGSEGTLGIITEVILRVEPVFEKPDWFAIPCADAKEFVRISKILKKLKFTNIEVYDAALFNQADTTGKTCGFYRKAPDEGYLIIANTKDDARRDRRRKLAKLKKALTGKDRIIVEDVKNSRDFVAVNENLLAYLNDAGANYYLPLVDGTYIPEEKQADFLRGLQLMTEKFKLKLAVYGSVDFNTFTVRPSFTPATSEGRKELISFLRKYLKLVEHCEGYPCGDAPEGRFLAMFTRPSEDTETLAIYGKIKEIFDPYDILNPGLKQEVEPRNVLRHFRTDYNDGVNTVK
ncbi:FAD-binding oxidoreductase [Candidatus Saccharibacteria bacterium]|nr:FAD-binding oxidoreductase [Candidatus Saccharibacteria bacterium]